MEINGDLKKVYTRAGMIRLSYLVQHLKSINIIPNWYEINASFLKCTGSASSQCLRDFRSSSGSFGSPVLVTSVELNQAETELSSLKAGVIMTANRCSDSTFDYSL